MAQANTVALDNELDLEPGKVMNFDFLSRTYGRTEEAARFLGFYKDCKAAKAEFSSRGEEFFGTGTLSEYLSEIEKPPPPGSFEKATRLIAILNCIGTTKRPLTTGDRASAIKKARTQGQDMAQTGKWELPKALVSALCELEENPPASDAVSSVV